MSEQTTDMQIAEIFDILYANYTECESVTLRIGIWDAAAVPYTFYALLHTDEYNILAGESSYGSETLSEAIQCLYNEVVELEWGHHERGTHAVHSTPGRCDTVAGVGSAH